MVKKPLQTSLKNPFQPIRDIMPYYPGCIRVIFLMLLTIGLIIGGIILIDDGRVKDYVYYNPVTKNYDSIEKEGDTGKLIGGSIILILGIPLFLTTIFYYYFLGCGYNRFYTNNLVKFEGNAVKRARKL